jgi:hypothetical protein
MHFKIEKGEKEQTWEEMSELCKKFGGRLLGKYWAGEIDKYKYDLAQDALEWEDLKEKEKERKAREAEKKNEQSKPVKKEKEAT